MTMTGRTIQNNRRSSRTMAILPKVTNSMNKWKKNTLGMGNYVLDDNQSASANKRRTKVKTQTLDYYIARRWRQL
jgi:hypothetical protein